MSQAITALAGSNPEERPSKRRRVEKNERLHEFPSVVQKIVIRYLTSVDYLMHIRNSGPLGKKEAESFALGFCQQLYLARWYSISIRNTAESFGIELPPQNFKDPAKDR